MTNNDELLGQLHNLNSDILMDSYVTLKDGGSDNSSPYEIVGTSHLSAMNPANEDERLKDESNMANVDETAVPHWLKLARSIRSISYKRYGGRHDRRHNRWLKRYIFWDWYTPYRKTFDPLASNLIG